MNGRAENDVPHVKDWSQYVKDWSRFKTDLGKAHPGDLSRLPNGVC
ncbi:hypothetical protein ACPOL_5697 [Acidisarcina polymorpha]|uniref:Uncharacterized protein n=1 Tax=Acidisarcina polymorpha TaxID=2211140 RepID=A0A2Z5G6P9_9BACT|nr:hypothetical protein ACPOL_5697 [Acidisarcina polymorpha]